MRSGREASKSRSSGPTLLLRPLINNERSKSKGKSKSKQYMINVHEHCDCIPVVASVKPGEPSYERVLLKQGLLQHQSGSACKERERCRGKKKGAVGNSDQSDPRNEGSLHITIKHLAGGGMRFLGDDWATSRGATHPLGSVHHTLATDIMANNSTFR